MVMTSTHNEETNDDAEDKADEVFNITDTGGGN